MTRRLTRPIARGSDLRTDPDTVSEAGRGAAPGRDAVGSRAGKPVARRRAAPAPVVAPPVQATPVAPKAAIGPGTIQVEIDAAVDGWPVRLDNASEAQARFDVALRGLITATAPIESCSVQDPSGREIVGIQFGLRDVQQVVTLPAGDPAFRVGFQVYLPMPGGEAMRIADLWVRARALDGAFFDAAMRIGCTADKAAILAGPAAEIMHATMPAPPCIVYLESAELIAGHQLMVKGWALATSSVVEAQILIDGTRVGAAVLGRRRGDVAEAYPGYPGSRDSGFSLDLTLREAMRGAVSVTARVLCQSGASHAATIPLIHAETSAPSAAPPEPVPPEPVPPAPVPPAPVPPAPVRSAPEPTAAAAPAEADQGPDEILPSAAEPSPGAPDGPAWDLGRAILLICDHAVVTAESMLRVRGWSACGHGIERVSIAVDGRHLGDAEYGRERPDVAVDYPGMPVATGFIFEQTVPGLAGGAHELRLTAVSHAGDRKDIAVPVRPPATAAFRFELDGPATKDGVAIRPVSGRLLIEGWALARDGMAGIDVELDGTPLGHAHYGMARPDVGAAFPDWDGASRAGYTFHCPARALPEGEHVIQLTARSKTGEAHVHAFHITVRKTDNPEAEASIRRRIKRVERNMVDGVLDQLGWRPAFHLIVTGDADAQEAARTLTIRSIVEQSWSAWRVTVLGSDAAEAEAARDTIARLAPEDAGRFAVIDPADPAWTAPFVIGETASLVGVLAIGDELGRDALGAFAIATGVHPNADCLYADEFRLAPGGTRPEAFFKPDFSPGLSLAANYLGRPLIARPSLLERIGTTPESLLRDGFHDLALRCAEAAADIRHVPELLSRTDGAGAANRDHGADPSRAAMDRRGIAAEVLPGAAPSTWRVRRTAPVTGKVSIIIPTRAAKGHIETCLKTLRDVTAYRNFEIVCIDNIPATEPRWKEFVRQHADKVVEIPPPFNWSRFNNDAATAADGEYLLFLNDDIEIEQPDWLETMLEAASWPGVGIVGARLLYPNRTVQHAGMFLGDGMGRHAFRHAEETDPGYFGLALTTREMIAVTGACLLVRRDIFDRLGRFDEAHDVINNDLDFCLRAHRAGLRTIYTPYATLIHHELASRESLAEDYDTARFTGAWRGLFAAGDPYFNPRMSRYSDDYRLDDEGVLAMYAGHPLLDRAAVKAILVVKVDHIGDFIISLPAIRRLKTAFPMAKLVALVAPASAAIASVEPAIDEAIPFEFFHERSELGEKALTEVELEALTARLAPYRFDIAVDLRKHLSTRHLLLCAGARITAGYDSLENFPWLDVVLEWDGDKALQRKRSHIVDDLVNLSAAIETACEPDRRLFHPAPEPMPVSELPEHARHLFARPVVAIHPGSGNVMRQWPEKHIAPLIDLLLERNDVSVLVVGGRDDEAKAEAIVARVARPDRVATVAGQTRLGDLPRLLAACALFIGGNSGPKHIAAASGVPTIGIHSGVVDPGEWGPMGPRSVALYRDMSCAPCFLAKPEHCPRNLACVEMLDPALVHRTAQMFLAKPERPASVEPMAPPAVKPVRRPAEKKPVKPARRMKVAARK